MLVLNNCVAHSIHQVPSLNLPIKQSVQKEQLYDKYGNPVDINSYNYNPNYNLITP